MWAQWECSHVCGESWKATCTFCSVYLAFRLQRFLRPLVWSELIHRHGNYGDPTIYKYERCPDLASRQPQSRSDSSN